MRRGLALLLVTFVLFGCRGAPLSRTPFDLESHLGDAAVGQNPRAPDPALADFEASVLALGKAWEAKLAAPSKLQASVAFDTPAMLALREQAAGEDFAESLGQGISEDQILAAAFERSPAIRAARLKLRGSIEQFAQVTYLDNILRQ